MCFVKRSSLKTGRDHKGCIRIYMGLGMAIRRVDRLGMGMAGRRDLSFSVCLFVRFLLIFMSFCPIKKKRLCLPTESVLSAKLS